MSYAIWQRNLFVVAGADDMAQLQAAPTGRRRLFDWFLGVQLVFNDEDLRSLLLFGGGAAAGAASQVTRAQITPTCRPLSKLDSAGPPSIVTALPAVERARFKQNAV